MKQQLSNEILELRENEKRVHKWENSRITRNAKTERTDLMKQYATDWSAAVNDADDLM